MFNLWSKFSPPVSKSVQTSVQKNDMVLVPLPTPVVKFSETISLNSNDTVEGVFLKNLDFGVYWIRVEEKVSDSDSDKSIPAFYSFEAIVSCKEGVTKCLSMVKGSHNVDLVLEWVAEKNLLKLRFNQKPEILKNAMGEGSSVLPTNDDLSQIAMDDESHVFEFECAWIKL